MAQLAHIYRHPIKSAGREAISEVTLEAGKTMPWDRVWAIANEAARLDLDTPEWAPCANFVRCSKSPGLSAITAEVLPDNRLRLSHPDHADLEIDPDADPDALVRWVHPICNPNRALPTSVYRVTGRGMTDTDYPSISILSLNSLRALSQKAGQELEHERFRGNLWLDGLGPWEEFEWIGKRLSIGEAEFEIRERNERCTATHASSRTGRLDAKTLSVLQEGWGHLDFGVYGVVTKPGRVALGDTATLI